jgi:hypothetical protein
VAFEFPVKRIVVKDLADSGLIANHHLYVLADPRLDGFLDSGCQFVVCFFFRIERQVAAVDVARDVFKSESLEHFAKLGHLDHRVSANVDAAKKRHVSHKSVKKFAREIREWAKGKESLSRSFAYFAGN